MPAILPCAMSSCSSSAISCRALCTWAKSTLRGGISASSVNTTSPVVIACCRISWWSWRATRRLSCGGGVACWGGVSPASRKYRHGATPGRLDCAYRPCCCPQRQGKRRHPLCLCTGCKTRQQKCEEQVQGGDKLTPQPCFLTLPPSPPYCFAQHGGQGKGYDIAMGQGGWGLTHLQLQFSKRPQTCVRPCHALAPCMPMLGWRSISRSAACVSELKQGLS